jgi:hypothetical protein
MIITYKLKAGKSIWTVTIKERLDLSNLYLILPYS